MPNHRPLADMPPAFQAICDAFVVGLKATLGDKLYGVYLYGAAVFADGGPAQDVDCHVILNSRLSETERQEIGALHTRLAEAYPPLGAELDAYFILYDAARLPENPQHQLRSDIYDNAWALHSAHIRAGQYETLSGPAPDDIFPAPTWTAVASALDNELAFVRANTRYPAFCILNLCRIIYSFQTRDVVVSKRFSGQWARGRYPEWASLIAAAERYYDRADALATELELVDSELDAFLRFAEAEIRAARSTQP